MKQLDAFHMLKGINKIKNVLVVIPILITTSFCYPQGKEANIWYFGWGAGINFNNGSPPFALTNSQMYIPTSDVSGSAVISDSNGSLLFYSDGITIWNKQHQVMMNGENMGINSTQGGIIVPSPNNENIYYFFNYEWNQSAWELYFQYSIIDMELDGGLGAVKSNMKGINLLTNPTYHLSASHHANGSDVWILTHGNNSNIYYSYLVTEDSLNSNPVISQAGSVFDYDAGYMKISPGGNFVAVAQNTGTDEFLELLNFNTVIGTVNDDFIVQFPLDHSSLEFSPDNTRLYGISARLYQYDLEAGGPEQIIASALQLSSEPFNYGAMQIGPDGKIYVSNSAGYYLHVIHKPNELGLDCDFELNAVYLDGRECTGGLPAFIQSYMNDPEFETQNNCLGDATQFTILETNGMDSVFWKFNDFPNMPYDTSTLFNPSYTFSFADTFLVELTAYSNLNVRTVTQEVVIHPIPEPDLGNDTLLCNTSFSITLNANCEGDVFAWSNGQFGTPEITVSDTGLYVVIVSKNGCSNSDSIYIGLYPQTEVDSSGLVIIPASCGVANGSITGLQVNGTEPLLYFWLEITGDTVGFDLDIENLNAGIYTLHVSDGNGCANNIGSYIVTDDGMMQVDSVQHTNDHCSQLGATIQVFAQEIGTGTISYSIDGGITYLQNDGVFTDLSAGTYNVMIIDENNCEGIYQNNPVVIQNIPGPEVTSVMVVPEEDYGQNGQIDMQAIVSWGNAFYSIDNGLNFQQGNGLFINLSAGTYICVVQDTFGCDTTFIVEVPLEFTIRLQAVAGDDEVCPGNAAFVPLLVSNFNDVAYLKATLLYNKDFLTCTGFANAHTLLEDSLEVLLFPLEGKIELNWSSTAISLPDNTIMADLVFESIDPGMSLVEWDGSAGASLFQNSTGLTIPVDYFTGNVKIYNEVSILLSNSEEVCRGESLEIEPGILSSNGDVSYLWTYPNGDTSDSETLSFYNIQEGQSGTYSVIVSDTLDCQSEASVDVIVHPLPIPDFPGQDTIITEEAVEIDAGANYVTYLWNTGENTQWITASYDGWYGVIIESQQGCMGGDSVYVLFFIPPEPIVEHFYVPNAFSPDGDGLNDEFKALSNTENISSFHMYIFNRWGQMIFESSDMQHGWDGTYKGKPAMGGLYVYRIDYTVSGSQSQENETLTGNVVLLR